jgi:hypothetical protein
MHTRSEKNKMHIYYVLLDENEDGKMNTPHVKYTFHTPCSLTLRSKDETTRNPHLSSLAFHKTRIVLIVDDTLWHRRLVSESV